MTPTCFWQRKDWSLKGTQKKLLKWVSFHPNFQIFPLKNRFFWLFASRMRFEGFSRVFNLNIFGNYEYFGPEFSGCGWWNFPNHQIWKSWHISNQWGVFLPLRRGSIKKGNSELLEQPEKSTICLFFKFNKKLSFSLLDCTLALPTTSLFRKWWALFRMLQMTFFYGIHTCLKISTHITSIWNGWCLSYK